jgi:septal ring factor EnvC (AmiA/AmiB activator)
MTAHCTLTLLHTTRHEQVVAMLQAQVDPTAAATTQVELKQLADELAQLREEHAEVSGIYIAAQQERDAATALVQKLEATIADLETSQAQEVVRLETAVATLQAGQITAAEEVATEVTAR